MRNLLRKNYTIVASSKEYSGRASEDNIVSLHAYTILDAESMVKDKIIEVGNNRLLQLRNPQGGNEYEGKWGDTDAENLTRENLRILHKKQKKKKMELFYKNTDDGVFWISEEAFIASFDNVSFCELNTIDS